jgi:hypothetical protein
MEKFSRPSRERPEEKRFPSIQNSGIEMRYGHRRSGIEGLPINFGLMFPDDFRVIANEPFSADWKAAQTFAFRDSGFLKNPKTASPSSNKDKLRPIRANLIRAKILDTHVPAGVRLLEISHAMIAGYAAAVLP